MRQNQPVCRVYEYNADLSLRDNIKGGSDIKWEAERNGDDSNDEKRYVWAGSEEISYACLQMPVLEPTATFAIE